MKKMTYIISMQVNQKWNKYVKLSKYLNKNDNPNS